MLEELKKKNLLTINDVSSRCFKFMLNGRLQNGWNDSKYAESRRFDAK